VGLGVGLIGAVLMAGLIFGFYIYRGLTRVNSTVDYGTPAFLEARSAADKLRIWEDSQKAKSIGFVRLTESEINSLLHWMLFSGKAKPLSAFVDPPRVLRDWDTTARARMLPAPPASTCHLLDVRVRFDPLERNLVWHSWVKKSWHGQSWTLHWERRANLTRSTNGWGFTCVGMRVGNLEIPEQYRPWVRQFLGEADAAMADMREWFENLPAVELALNATTEIPELKIYNYPEPLVLSKTPP
jgi:hypothetical protein